MKLPFLPIHIDSFVRSSEAVSFTGATVAANPPQQPIYFLSHAHTDHMAGLTPHWEGGIIFATEITREVVLQKMEDDAHRQGGVSGPHDRKNPRALSLADRIVPLPFWVRLPLLSRQRPREVTQPEEARSLNAGTTLGSPSEDESSSVQMLSANETQVQRDEDTVYVTLLPAFHIPGSAMLYFETPYGRVLYTGDFKYEPTTAAPVLAPFFQTHPVDHVYLDDTWLHLGVTVSAHTYAMHEAPGERLEDPSGRQHAEPSLPAESMYGGNDQRNNGSKVLSKLLNAAQVEEAVEAIGRRLDAQRRRFSVEAEVEALVRRRCCDRDECSCEPPLPYILRVYLHNQFGKEMLVQKIAERLGTRAMLDDGRYARVAIVSAVLNGGADVDEQSDGSRSPVGHAPSHHVTDTDSDDDIAAAFGESMPCHSHTHASLHALARWRERDVYRLDLAAFMSYSQRQQLIARIRRLCSEARGAMRADGGDEGDRAALQATLAQLRDAWGELPLIHVVDTRAKISSEALQQAARLSGHSETPHYGVVMSGWARLQPMRQSASEVWQVPTTLHCTPQEIIDFVAALRPQSVTPLHYRASRSPAVVMQRLGPHLRRPFVNECFAMGATTGESEVGPDAAPLSNAGPSHRWWALVELPTAFTDSVRVAGPGGLGDGRGFHGAIEDGVGWLGARQRGFRIAAPLAPYGDEASLAAAAPPPPRASPLRDNWCSSMCPGVPPRHSVSSVVSVEDAFPVRPPGAGTPSVLAALCETLDSDVDAMMCGPPQARRPRRERSAPVYSVGSSSEGEGRGGGTTLDAPCSLPETLNGGPRGSPPRLSVDEASDALLALAESLDVAAEG